MLESSHRRVEQYPVQPWKNGGGQTREIAVDTENPYRWRLSWATVSRSGPFSLYPGYDRTLVIWRGGTIAISHGNKAERRLSPLQTYSFKGEWETAATVSSPVDDFNAFALRGKAKVGIYPSSLAANEDLQFPIAAQDHFLFGVDGEIEILEPNQNRSYRLLPGESVRVTRRSEDEYLNIRARGVAARSACLWVVVRIL